MRDAVRIGILGDFDAGKRSHHATNQSLHHAAASLGLEVETEWIPTPSLLLPGAASLLESCDALWASPGSPYRSAEGMMEGIRFAREGDHPFLGTCGGFQYALLELARNVHGIADADTAENNSGSKNIVIYPVECAIPDRPAGAPKLSGKVPQVRLRPGSYLQSFYSQDSVVEEFFCNFEVNPEFAWVPVEAGCNVVARGPQDEMRAIESPSHRFFIATLFQPQLSSEEKNPHPLIVAFLRAAAAWHHQKLDDSVLE